jgi:L-asparaginase II
MHRGDAVVTSPGGKILALSGDAYKYTYFRSSAKPMQALNVILSGATERFGLSEEELAVICSSHYAEDCHLQAVADLQSGVARSIRPEIAFAQAEAGIQPMRLLSDCSGKHSGMLATCIARGYPIQGYLNPSHPVQQEILRIIADICLYPIEKIGIGVDGCNVAVFALPIYNMAVGFARLANPDYLPQAYKSPAIQIFRSMTTHRKWYPAPVAFALP